MIRAPIAGGGEHQLGAIVFRGWRSTFLGNVAAILFSRVRDFYRMTETTGSATPGKAAGARPDQR